MFTVRRRGRAGLLVGLAVRGWQLLDRSTIFAATWCGRARVAADWSRWGHRRRLCREPPAADPRTWDLLIRK
ncbi:hypothetical protein L839_0008 [Mycobacterium avium MAV_120809_2495]|uniref:hypothetical protein n=1 Tax=Mycobacterium avium TaxID=1764 RepID=UPI00044D95F9|nr:hypothetical protein L839_0008 [Mycobacterium avium MAV_120809_2495]